VKTNGKSRLIINQSIYSESKITNMEFPIIRFSYNFYAVGHGLFSSGQLLKINPDCRFNWVFDCGSKNSKYWNREIAYYKSSIQPDKIHLLCISHFDKDHIEGAKTLLTEYPIISLVMPYFPLC